MIEQWDPDRYNRFAAERRQPFWDLAGLLRPVAAPAVVDPGFGEQHVRLQVYGHHLASTAEVVAWVKGTTLTRFKAPPGEDGWPSFVDAYRARLLSALGDRAPYYYPFKRILLWGRRG